MSKKLNIQHPPITSYQHHTAILSIPVHDKSYNDWIYYQYIQLFAVVESGRISFFDFYPTNYIFDSTPWVRTEKMNKDDLDKTDIVKFIMESINQDKYVYIVLECSEILAHNTPNKSFPHPIIIYGYNSDTQTFYISDFFNSVYSFQEASFNEIRMGYERYMSSSFWWEGAKLITYTERPRTNTAVTSEMYKSILLDYMDATERADYFLDYGDDVEHFIHSVPEFGVGFSIYQNIIDNLTNRLYLDYRILPILTDHKKNLCNLILSLKRKGALSPAHPDFTDILHKTKIARNLFIKASITHVTNSRHRLVDLILQIRELEHEAMFKLIRAL